MKLYYVLSELGTCSLFPGSLSAHFLSMDRYRSIAHFADFQVRSSVNWKRALKRSFAPKTTAVRSYVCIVYTYVPSDSESELCVREVSRQAGVGGHPPHIVNSQ